MPRKGYKRTEETKKKIGDANRGKKRTEESKKKMSDALKGKYIGEKSWKYGKPWSEESKKKLSIAKGGRPEGPIMKTIKKLRDTLSNEEKKELNPAKACILISCQPAVELLEKVVDKHPSIDFEKTKKIIQEIEKRLFKKNLYRSSLAVVGLAIYLSNNITQEQTSSIIRDFGGCTAVSLRNLLKKTGLKKKKKSQKRKQKKKKKLVKKLPKKDFIDIYIKQKAKKNKMIDSNILNQDFMKCQHCKKPFHPVGLPNHEKECNMNPNIITKPKIDTKKLEIKKDTNQIAYWLN